MGKTIFLKRKFLIILGFMAIFLCSCQNDDFYEENKTSSKNIKVQRLKFSDLQKHPKVLERIETLTNRKGNYQARMVEMPQYNFTVDTDEIIFIEADTLISYTFRIYREDENGLLENLVLKPSENGNSYDAFLFQYDFSEEDVELYQNGQPISNQENKTQITYLPDFDETPLYNARYSSEGGPPSIELPSGCAWELIDYDYYSTSVPGGIYWEQIEYWQVNCGGGGSSGGDGSSSGSNNGGWTGNGNTGTSPGDGNSNGNQNGGGNGNGGTRSVSPIVTTPVGIDGAPSKKECAKIAKALNDYPDFKQKLLDLAAAAPTATNEKVIVLHKDGTDAEYTGQSGVVETPPNPDSKYTAMAHNHDGQNTYSVFSAGDFGLIGLIDVAYDKLDIDKFVSFLVTAKGTRYAFTINNKAKFRSFYEYIKMKRSDVPLSEYNQYLQILKQRQTVLDKYYLEDRPHPTHPLIKETSNNTSMDLLLFVKFLEEADMGISVFEVDENFENFKEVKKNPNDPTQVTKSNCK